MDLAITRECDLSTGDLLKPARYYISAPSWNMNIDTPTITSPTKINPPCFALLSTPLTTRGIPNPSKKKYQNPMNIPPFSNYSHFITNRTDRLYILRLIYLFEKTGTLPLCENEGE